VTNNVLYRKMRTRKLLWDCSLPNCKLPNGKYDCPPDRLEGLEEHEKENRQ